MEFGVWCQCFSISTISLNSFSDHGRMGRQHFDIGSYQKSQRPIQNCRVKKFEHKVNLTVGDLEANSLIYPDRGWLDVVIRNIRQSNRIIKNVKLVS